MYNACPMLKAENIIKEKTGISILYQKYTLKNSKVVHWHNYYTIDFVLSGEGIHHLNGCDYPVQKGDIVLVKPTDIHYIYSNTMMKTVAIRFTDYAMDNKYIHLMQYPTAIHRLSEEDSNLLTMYCNSISRCNSSLLINPEDALCQDELLLSFRLVLVLLARQKNSFPTITANRVTKIIQYLNMHFRKQISQEKIADMFGLNPTYFSVWFKKHVGTSYIDYINSRRIEYACYMLKNGSPVIESCFESGFCSLSHFNHVFKKTLGKRPSEYKKST